MGKRTMPSGAVSSGGIAVFDCGTYFRVCFDGLEVSHYPKSYNGFRTAGELLAWLLSK